MRKEVVHAIIQRKEERFMFRMYIKLNEKQLLVDGMGSKSSELSKIVKNIDSYTIDKVVKDVDGNTEHEFSTTQFGDESYLISLLEETPWFMKYVLVWNTNDNGYFSDMIAVEREMGLKCSYAG